MNGGLRYGFWRTQATNPALLAAQLVVFFNAANRGTDYLTDRSAEEPGSSLAEITNAVSLPVWGWMFYGLAVLGVLGLALRNLFPVCAAHLGLFALYAGIGSALLGGGGIHFTPVAWLGGVVAAAGCAMMWSERFGPGLRLGLALPLMLVGQLALTEDLGPGYRAGLGLLGGGLLHAILAAGTIVAWLRQLLAPLVDPDALPDPEEESGRAR